MSSLSYYKMLVVGKQVKKKIENAKMTCKSKPKSKECQDAMCEVLKECEILEEHMENTLKEL